MYCAMLDGKVPHAKSLKNLTYVSDGDGHTTGSHWLASQLAVHLGNLVLVHVVKLGVYSFTSVQNVFFEQIWHNIIFYMHFFIVGTFKIISFFAFPIYFMLKTGFWAWFYEQIYKCCNTSHKCILLVIGLGFQMSFVMSMHSLLPILLAGCSISTPNYFERLTFRW